jgi:hypothetical protein
MKRVLRIPSLVTAVLMVGACQQIIGLSDYEAVDEQEEGGGAGKGGSGGSTSGGKGGTGGKAGGTTGGSAGKGGTGGKGGTSGEAGEGGMGADGGTGGSSGGTGGTAGKGGNAGSGGKGNCTELTLQGVVGMSTTPEDQAFRGAVFNVAIQQQLVGSAEDTVGFQFYQGDAFDGAATGTFELGTGVDDNYSSCGRCLLVERDAAVIGNAGNTRFFATSGTIEVASDSEHMNGRPVFTISDVTLVEVTIETANMTYVSTPVDGGDCYHIDNYTIEELPRPSWTCPEASWGDALCDCGCDEPDLECDSTLIAACEECTSAGSCAQTDCSEIDFADNSQCSTTNPLWTCPPAAYGDGSCSCGCGTADPDCFDDYVGSCDSCDEAGSCDEDATDCSGIDFTDNSQCSAANPVWTCPPLSYGDGSCSCGCGSTDPDCENEYAGACDSCTEAGSCDEAGTDCSGITFDDNATCSTNQSWTCAPSYYFDGGCDCGCGVVDVDCVDATADSCEYCGGAGSCATECADIDPMDNSHCTSSGA